MNWQLNTCHDVQFVYFQLTFTEFAMVIYKTKMSIAHMYIVYLELMIAFCLVSS